MSNLDGLLHGNFHPFGNIAPEQIVTCNVCLTKELGPELVGVIIHLQNMFYVQLLRT